MHIVRRADGARARKSKADSRVTGALRFSAKYIVLFSVFIAAVIYYIFSQIMP